MTLPTGTPTDNPPASTPARELLKRIDIGLTTGIVAVFISFLALIVAWNQTRLASDTAKASVLPIVDVDLGYVVDGEALFFEVKLDNVGVGVADIYSLRTLKDGEPFADEAAFQSSVMSPNMVAWSEAIDGEAVNYLAPNESTTPLRYLIRNPYQARSNDYLDGSLGEPMAGVDVEVCYCSVFDDCWTVRHLDRAKPSRVASCGTGDVPADAFADYRAARLSPKDDTP